MYKLINIETKEDYICEKKVIDGFDYYVIDSHLDNHFKIKKSDLSISERGRIRESGWNKYLTIIATNNTTIDIPQLVDEVEEMAKEIKQKYGVDSEYWYFKKGYNKAKEQTQYSKQDMIEFAEWVEQNATRDPHFKQNWMTLDKRNLITSELLELFEQSRPKTIYFK